MVGTVGNKEGNLGSRTPIQNGRFGDRFLLLRKTCRRYGRITNFDTPQVSFGRTLRIAKKECSDVRHCAAKKRRRSVGRLSDVLAMNHLRSRNVDILLFLDGLRI